MSPRRHVQVETVTDLTTDPGVEKAPTAGTIGTLDFGILEFDDMDAMVCSPKAWQLGLQHRAPELLEDALLEQAFECRIPVDDWQPEDHCVLPKIEMLSADDIQDPEPEPGNAQAENPGCMIPVVPSMATIGTQVDSGELAPEPFVGGQLMDGANSEAGERSAIQQCSPRPQSAQEKEAHQGKNTTEKDFWGHENFPWEADYSVHEESLGTVSCSGKGPSLCCTGQRPSIACHVEAMRADGCLQVGPRGPKRVRETPFTSARDMTEDQELVRL